MIGSSCEQCIFSTWQNQTQIGCLLNRLDKYENISVINDDYSGTYRVISNHICTAKRKKDWLNKNPKRPELVVRKELYPKIQLILLIDKYNDNWRDFLQKNDFSDYNNINILLFDLNADMLTVSKNVRADHNISQCYPANHPTLSDKDHHINNAVNPRNKFYLLIDNPFNNLVEKWPDKVDYILNDQCKSIAMCLYHEKYNNLLIDTITHLYLGGYGQQSIEEKIEIYCDNNDKMEMIHWFEDLFDESADT